MGEAETPDRRRRLAGRIGLLVAVFYGLMGVVMLIGHEYSQQDSEMDYDPTLWTSLATYGFVALAAALWTGVVSVRQMAGSPTAYRPMLITFWVWAALMAVIWVNAVRAAGTVDLGAVASVVPVVGPPLLIVWLLSGFRVGRR